MSIIRKTGWIDKNVWPCFSDGDGSKVLFCHISQANAAAADIGADRWNKSSS